MGNLEECYQMTLKAEKKLNRASMKRIMITPSIGTSKEKLKTIRPSTRSTSLDKMNVNEHASNSYGHRKEDGCFRCGLEGHMAYECPQKKKETRLNLIHEDEDK